MTDKHTPGPWRTRQATGDTSQHIYGGSVLVAVIPYRPNNQAERASNARLITAAPELLEALEDIEVYIEDGAYNTALDLARAAIKAAKGDA